eukprot:2638294-Pleurochrysis_carterae.AAC.1
MRACSGGGRGRKLGFGWAIKLAREARPRTQHEMIIAAKLGASMTAHRTRCYRHDGTLNKQSKHKCMHCGHSQ